MGKDENARYDKSSYTRTLLLPCTLRAYHEEEVKSHDFYENETEKEDSNRMYFRKGHFTDGDEGGTTNEKGNTEFNDYQCSDNEFMEIYYKAIDRVLIETADADNVSCTKEWDIREEQ